MAELSKFYKVTNLIMVEYVADLYAAHQTADTESVDFMVYTGKDENVYYMPYIKDNNSSYNYSNPLYFTKFPDESDSEYQFLGLTKNNDRFTNYNLIEENIDNIVQYHTASTGPIHYDKIRIHFIYGFMLDNLAGFTVQVKTNARYLGPVLKVHPRSVTHMLYDDNNVPIFETCEIMDQDGNMQTVEKLVYNQEEITLLDIFFPKECMVLDNMVKWHVTPIYQNGCFYDRYLEFFVPSAYYLSLDSDRNGISLTVNNPYGYDHRHIVTDTDGNTMYALIPEDPNARQITYTVLNDPTVLINFATVSEQNVTVTNTDSEIYYKCAFVQDPINQISLKYKSNSDYFNVRLFEDNELNEIIYYPVFGEGDNAVELNYDIFNQIESGTIPLMTEGFYDGMSNIDSFYEMYGENAYKWIIYNDITVTYNYSNFIKQQDTEDIIASKFTLNFTNVIDYGIPNPEAAGKFWKSSFVPKVPVRNNMYCSSISVLYVCRLINRLTSVEAIRRATLTINNPQKYATKRIALNNVVTYKVVNQIKNNTAPVQHIQKEYQDKLIRSYYDATNIVIKDMESNNTFTLDNMTLYLKHTSTNYVLRLFTLNNDNIRVPYDLTGPYRYLLVFPTNEGDKIKIKPNADSNALNLGIGQLAFYITEEQVNRIMNVPDNKRYFAIITDSYNNDTMQSTLYEGKVNQR